jgi:hypothetical protein
MSSEIMIRGNVKFSPSSLPAADVKVELWDDENVIGWICSATTNKAGEFTCVIPGPLADTLSIDGLPANQQANGQGQGQPAAATRNLAQFNNGNGAIPVTLAYKVKKNNIVLAEDVITAPDQTVEIQVSNFAFDQTVATGAPTQPIESLARITGTIKDANGAPCNELTVSVYENGFRESKLIGSATTDDTGHYAVEINNKFTGSNINTATSIKVTVGDGKNTLASSGDIFNWQKNVVVDLAIDAVNKAKEFTAYTKKIVALTDDVMLDTIVVSASDGVDEVKYIAGATGLSEHTVEAVVNAHKYAVAADVPADVVYALLRHTKNNSDPLINIKPKAFRNIVTDAIMNNIISAYPAEPSDPPGERISIEELVSKVRAYQVKVNKNTPVTGEAYSINDLMLAIFDGIANDTIAAQKMVDDFLLAYTADYESLDDFWGDYEYTGNEPHVKLGLRLASITNYQPQIVKMLLSEIGQGHISELALWTVDTWKSKIGAVCTETNYLCVPAAVRGDETFPMSLAVHEEYANRLAAIIQAMYPLATIAAFISGPDGATIIPEQNIREEVVNFITDNKEFDARITSVYNINNTDHDLTNVTSLEDLQAGLAGIARLARVTGGNPTAIITLLQNNINSSRDIALMGWDEFNSSYGYLCSPQDVPANPQATPAGPCALQKIKGLVPTSNEVFSRAQSIHNGLMAALGGAAVDAVDGYPGIITNATPVPVTNVIDAGHLPVDGTGISVPYTTDGGPAATPSALGRLNSSDNYIAVNQGTPIVNSATTATISGVATLASLIGSLDYSYINDSRSVYSPAAYLADTLHYLKLNANSIYNALDTKRPDIKFIDLSIDNTETPVPYIDLVNELLEMKVQAFDTTIPKPSDFKSFNTKAQLNLSAINKDQTIVSNGPASVGSGNAQLSLQQPIELGNKNVSQNIIGAANNNVKVAVNKVVLNNGGTSKAVTGNKISARIIGNPQAAYPERTYKNAAGANVDYTAHATGTVYSYDAIYNKLANAVYPQALPFNMAIEESRTYLNLFGNSRLQLMKQLRPVNPPTGATDFNSITDFSITAEFLGLTTTAATIVDGSHANYTGNVFTFYGATSATSGFNDPITNTTIGSGTQWEDVLSSRVDILLQQTGITYTELLQYLTTDYLNPFLVLSGATTTTRRVSIQTTGTGIANDTGKLNELRLVFNYVSGSTISSGNTTSNSTNGGSAFFKKLHAFIRLVRTGKMSIYHWDILLRSMMLSGDINTTNFLQIGRILMAAKDMNIAPELLSMFWSNADRKNYINYPNKSTDTLSSIYQDIFNNKSVVNNASSEIFSIPATDPVTYPATAFYATYAGQIGSYCGIKESEVVALLAYLGITSLTTTVITLPVLSKLYILAQLAAAWHYSIADFISLLKLNNITVSSANITDNTGLTTCLNTLRSISDVATAVNTTGFSLSELNYLTGDADTKNASAPPPSKIQAFLESLRKELSINKSYPGVLESPAYSDDEIAKDNLSILNKLKNIIYQHFSKEFGVSAEEAKLILNVTNTGSSADVPDGIIAKLMNDTDRIFSQSTFDLTESNIAYVDSLTNIAVGSLIDPATPAYPATSPVTYPIVLSAIPKGVQGNKRPSFALADLYKCYRYFHKVAFIYQKLGLRAKEFAYLLDISTSTVVPNQIGFKFTSLPVYFSGTTLKTITDATVNTSGSTGIVTLDLFNGLLRVSRMMDFVNMLSLPDDALGKILDASAGVTRINDVPSVPTATTTTVNDSFNLFLNTIKQANWGTAVNEILGSAATYVSSSASAVTTYGSATPSLLSLKFSTGAAPSDFKPNDYKNISRLIDAVSLINTAANIGLQPSSLAGLLTEQITNTQVKTLITAAKSKYSDDSWNDVAKPLRDVIRIKQRDSLIAYLRKSPAALFAEMLIDVQMEPGMMTSRIKQAISSVQLFIDRVIMGLEVVSGSIVTLPSGVLVQWQKWRKWYRIWEANRKIFFYPEDWMEPELRDDKTPFFKELEAELKQDAITYENAEKAITNYLNKLDEVSRLQPVGTCDETMADGTVITHVFGRTYGATHKYFHRKLINNMWTGWEEMGVEISGDHIVPFIWNKKLRIYWLTFIEKAAPFTVTMQETLDGLNSFAGIRARYTANIANADQREWFYKDPEEMGSDVNSINQSTSSSGNSQNMYKQLHVMLNWSEYENSKWSRATVGRENMVLKINPFLERLLYKSTNTVEKPLFKKLMDNGNTSITDFIKSRLFVYPYIHTNDSTAIYNSESGSGSAAYNVVNGDLYIMLMFPTDSQGFSGTSHKECADYLKAFHFSSSTNTLEVMKDTMFFKRVLPPSSMFFKNQSMISVEAGNDLNNETPNTSSGETIFNYEKVVTTGGNKWDNMPMGTSYLSGPFGTTFPSLVYLCSLPVTTYSSANRLITPRKSNYRIVTQAGFKGVALESPFLYEDSDNVFFVSKTVSSITADIPYSGRRTMGIAAAYNASAMGYHGADNAPMPQDMMKLIPSTVIRGGDLLSSDSSFSSIVPSSYTTTAHYFRSFYHHHIRVFKRMMNVYGIKGLMRPDLLGVSPLPIVQATRSGTNNDDTIDFAGQYAPNTAAVYGTYPTNRVDFSYNGAYSMYNWEIFFHAPMLIAQRLSENHQFFEAQKWYHYIFDPTSTTYLNNDTAGVGKQRFWKFQPFYANANSTLTLENVLSEIRTAMPGTTTQLAASLEHPFEPYMLGRIRPFAFMKNVLMKYLDNLIAWGDHLFQRDTIESINEASQLYILASNLLGSRPVETVQRVVTANKSFAELEPGTGVPGTATATGAAATTIDALGEAVVQIESILDPGIGRTTGSGTSITLGTTNYFGLQPNDKLMKYWDTVEDRLFKIRHSQNIDGVMRTLPLFEPPIDPSLLVQAAAGGLNINDVLDDVSGVNTPNYRFTYMVQKANEFLGDVKALGSSLLSALEKKDAEQLSVLRQGQELSLLNAMLYIKERQLDEAKANLDALTKSRDNTLVRMKHYETLISEDLNEHEKAHIQTIIDTQDVQASIVSTQELGHEMSLIPQFHAQAMVPGTSFGGQQLATAVSMITTALQGEATQLGLQGSLYSTMGGYKRRAQEWAFQVSSAKLEAEQLEKQLLAAGIRIKVAQKEYENQKLQIDNAVKVNEFMQFKYTCQELYDWMAAQISTTYYRAYQMAYSFAKKALLCYRLELPQSKVAGNLLIKSNYWDSRRKGLMAGESLQVDLRNMESNYIEDNKRTYELTKHISLAQLNPVQLAKLRATGYCSISIPEEWYDLDYPGHVNRTIKSVSVSIPCVSGPYTTIPCTLNLNSSYRRINSSADLKIISLPPCTKIATSTAQNDNGVFDFSFRDERYLPFEGAGAVSSWTLSLFNSSDLVSKPLYTNLDLNTISDVILHVKYTAQESGSSTFNNGRKNQVATYIGYNSYAVSPTTVVNLRDAITYYTPLGRIYSLKHEFANDWFTYATAINGGNTAATLTLQLKIDQFPAVCANRTVTISGIKFLSRLKDGGSAYPFSMTDTGNHLKVDSISNTVLTDVKYDTTAAGSLDPVPADLSLGNMTINNATTRTITWAITGDTSTDNLSTRLEDLYMVVMYKLS